MTLQEAVMRLSMLVASACSWRSLCLTMLLFSASVASTELLAEQHTSDPSRHGIYDSIVDNTSALKQAITSKMRASILLIQSNVAKHVDNFVRKGISSSDFCVISLRNLANAAFMVSEFMREDTRPDFRSRTLESMDALWGIHRVTRTACEKSLGLSDTVPSGLPPRLSEAL